MSIHLEERSTSKKYIYCIINSRQERHFGPIGIGGSGDEVITVGHGDLSMVISNSPVAKFDHLRRDNALAHEKVVEEVMKEFNDVLPVRFGTVAPGAGEIRNLLERRYEEFWSALKSIDNKVELGVKGIWKDMDLIFKEIVDSNPEIKKLKTKIQTGKKNDIRAKREIGSLVQKALGEKKNKEAEDIVHTLKKASAQHKLNSTYGDQLFINAAFLVDRGREKEFDNLIEDLRKENEDRVKFGYVGPLPPYNFVIVNIHLTEWEK